MTPGMIPKMILKYQPKGKTFGPTPQKMQGLCYVTPVIRHKAYTGKEEEEEEEEEDVLVVRRRRRIPSRN
jgi:hypothetical protein